MEKNELVKNIQKLDIHSMYLLWRNHIEKTLEKVPKGYRIHIDLDVLEKLLFYYETEIIEKRKVRIKWFNRDMRLLEKIDLSEVSFEDMAWCGIDLKNTNAKPDFSKSYNIKNNSVLYMQDIDLSNVDLSYYEFDTLDCSMCNFTNTKIRVKDWKKINAMHCIFDNNDLSLVDDIPCDVFLKHFILSSFRNTGLHFTGFATLNPTQQEEFQKLINEGYLDNCYLDGELIEKNLKEIEKELMEVIKFKVIELKLCQEMPQNLW